MLLSFKHFQHLDMGWATYFTQAMCIQRLSHLTYNIIATLQYLLPVIHVHIFGCVSMTTIIFFIIIIVMQLYNHKLNLLLLHYCGLRLLCTYCFFSQPKVFYRIILWGEYRVYANRTRAKKITILNFARFSGRDCHVLH